MRLGANPTSRCRLAFDTLCFHLVNGLRRSGGRVHRISPRLYRTKIGAQTVDLWLRPGSGDLFVFHEVFLSECYRLPQLWRDGVATIVDLGANVGLTTLFFTTYFPHAAYICVEPDPDNALLLQRNLSFLGPQICIVEGAVSGQPGEVLFSNDRPSWGNAIDRQRQQGRRVCCYSMHEIVALSPTGNIDILKVDIEGEEQQVFRDSGDWLSYVGLIIIELHSPYSCEMFTANMERAGFQVIQPKPDSEHRMIVAFNRMRVSNLSGTAQCCIQR